MYTKLSGQSITLLMGTLKMYSNAYSFEALEDYFKRINQWKDLGEDDRLMLLNRFYNGNIPDADALMDQVERLLKERNLP